MLMSLYNISINMKGVKYISENAGFFPLLWWLLNGKVFINTINRSLKCSVTLIF